MRRISKVSSENMIAQAETYLEPSRVLTMEVKDSVRYFLSNLYFFTK